MTAHLIAGTCTALIAITIAMLLRGRSAALRHGVLLAAVLSFAIPTPWLGKAGDKLAGCLPAKLSPPTYLNFESLFRTPRPPSAAPRAFTPLTAPPESHAVRNALYTIWAGVFILLVALWLRRLLRTIPPVRSANDAETEAMERARASLGLDCSIDLRITSSDRVPGARGVFRPCVILPDLLSEQLSEAELQAIMAHELAHVARRDNLSAAVVRMVVSVFWFHPLLWWMERRMLAEREAACDELVLAHGAEPEDYVSAILKVCRMSFAASGAGVSGYAGATGSNLNHRMEQIMFAHAVRPSSRFLRAIPAAVLVLACAVPVSERLLRAQTPPSAQAPTHSANDSTIQQARGCLQKGEFPEAEKLFRQVYTSDPVDSRGAIGLAETYMAENRSDQAIDLMQTEIRSHPDRADLPTMLGNLYLRAEQFDQAIAEFQGTLGDVKNLNADTLFRLGEAHRLKGDTDEAIRFFKASAALTPTFTTGLLMVAMTLQGTGRDDEAAPVYDEILKIRPDDAVALNNLAYIVAGQGRDYDRALMLAQRAVEAVKKSNGGTVPADFSDTIGWAHLKKNQPGEAVTAFRTALQSQPDNATFHYHLGLALLPIGERSAAILEFQEALAHNPPHDVEAPVRELLQKLAP